jgi:hypothetical protein
MRLTAINRSQEAIYGIGKRNRSLVMRQVSHTRKNH